MGTIRTMYENILTQAKHIASHKRIQLTIFFTNRIGNQPSEIPKKKNPKKKPLTKNPKFQQDRIFTKCINNNKQGSFERHYVIIIIISSSSIIIIKLLKAFITKCDGCEQQYNYMIEKGGIQFSMIMCKCRIQGAWDSLVILQGK
jgi:hypothetical protein